MKTTALTVLSLVAAIPCAFAQPVPAYADLPLATDPIPLCANGYRTLYCTPEYYTGGDLLFWTRRSPTGPLLVNRYTGETVADFRDDFRSRWALGPNITIGRRLEGCWSGEVTYFGIYHMDAAGDTFPGRADPVVVNPANPARRLAAEGLPFPNFPGGIRATTLEPGSRQNYQYRSNISDVELNLRNDVTDRFSWVVGARYLNLNDELSVTLYDRRGAAGAYGITARNNLYGAQAGLDYTAPVCDPLYLRFGGRAGIFGNSASQSTFGSFLNPEAPGRAGGRSAEGGQLSFVGQANLSLVYEVTPRFHVRTGYNVMFVSGVANSPGQTTASDFGPGGRGGINTRDNAFFHGLNFGMEYHR